MYGENWTIYLLGAWGDRACWEIKIRIVPINLPVFELFRIFALEIGGVYSARGWLTRRCTILVSVAACFSTLFSITDFYLRIAN